jgi:hypothetical protein
VEVHDELVEEAGEVSQVVVRPTRFDTRTSRFAEVVPRVALCQGNMGAWAVLVLWRTPSTHSSVWSILVLSVVIGSIEPSAPIQPLPSSSGLDQPWLPS